MTVIRWLVVAVGMSAVLATTSCTTTSAGTPLPDHTTIVSTDRPSTETSVKPSAERPRELDLQGKDPCAIPEGDWPRFGIEKPGKVDEHPDFKSPDCYYAGVGDVVLVATAGIETWNEDDYDAKIEDAEPIDGFHTITVASNVDQRACWAVVDVADGQFLMTIATPDPNDPSKPERCELAYQLAESAMKTFVAS